jgi:hypothetical protein
MFTKKLISISIATIATLGALAISAESASARPGSHGFRGGFHHGGFHGGRWAHGHWGHRYRWGFYGGPVVVGAASYLPECYYVRRRGILYKVCD